MSVERNFSILLLFKATYSRILCGGSFCCLRAEARRNHAVIRTWLASALHMPRNRHRISCPVRSIDVRPARKRPTDKPVHFSSFLLILSWSGLHFPWKSRPLRPPDIRGNSGHFSTAADRIYHHINIIRDLRQENDVSSARDACIERQPSHFVAHDLPR